MSRYPRIPTFLGLGVLAALFIAALAFLAAGSFGPRTADADPHAGQSMNVVIIGGEDLAHAADVVNGGYLPTSGPAGGLGDFNFSGIEVADVNAANLAPFDTVVLNVASNGLDCDINKLNVTQKADIVDFVAGGHKLIIYDSECSPQDYSWLPFPFTTNNPGAAGAQGTLNIVEENTLSTSAAGTHFIDAVALGTQTDAVGDMNVMVTLDSNWCLDMSGTNINKVTGPVHTYARSGTAGSVGLMIYNGLDVDLMGDEPTANGLEKIWLQELQQPFNPDNLPCEAPVSGISLTPETATNDVGTDHTVTAMITDLLGDPVEGVEVTFEVTDGPNAGATGTCSANADCTTDANGQVSFTYTSDGSTGTDGIEGCFVPEQDAVDVMPAQMVEPEVACDTAAKEWVEPTPTPSPTPTPTPTAVAEVVELPTTGGEPSDGGSSGLAWLAAIAGAIALTSAGGFWFAYQRRRVR